MLHSHLSVRPYTDAVAYMVRNMFSYGKPSSNVLFQLPAGVTNYTVAPLNGASIIIVLNGCATARAEDSDGIEIKRGSVLFVGANESVSMTISSCDVGMQIFRAFSVV
jgi:hypothetical protein